MDIDENPTENNAELTKNKPEIVNTPSKQTLLKQLTLQELLAQVKEQSKKDNNRQTTSLSTKNKNRNPLINDNNINIIKQPSDTNQPSNITLLKANKDKQKPLCLTGYGSVLRQKSKIIKNTNNETDLLLLFNQQNM